MAILAETVGSYRQLKNSRWLPRCRIFAFAVYSLSYRKSNSEENASNFVIQATIDRHVEFLDLQYMG